MPFPAIPVLRLVVTRSQSPARLTGLMAAAVLAAALLIPAPSHAQADGGITEETFAAVVKVSVKVPAGARTARRLGTEREGNGVVIDSNGLVLTISYIMLEADTIDIGLPDGTKVAARAISYDHETGFGLIRASKPLGIKPMAIGNSDTVKARDQVLVAAFGGRKSVIGAYVVSRRPFAGWWEYLLENAIFTSPPHPSFGGAALIDGDGRPIGIGSLIIGDAAGPDQPLPGNMFVPIDRLKPILADLLSQGRRSGPHRPWLGLTSEELRGRLFVMRVARGGPAFSAGIRPGDLVIGVDGKPVEGLIDFYRRVRATGDAGTEVTLNVLHGINTKTVVIKSMARYDWLQRGVGN